MSKITERVFELAKPVVEEDTWYLRIYIDKEGGVSIDDCERISRRLDPILDEADPIPESYVFEVGSAGADRELKRPSDFVQFMDSEIEVKLYKPLDGSKSFVGRLAGYEEGTVVLDWRGKELRFAPAQIAQVRLYVSF